jgi:hypothetical protein
MLSSVKIVSSSPPFLIFLVMLTVLTSVQFVKKILGVVKLHLAAHLIDLYIRKNKIF